MMVPKKSLFFAGATLLCMSTAFAQSAQSKKVSRVSNKTMQTASLDLQTGVITRGPSLKQKAAGPTATATSVNNIDFAGFIGVDSGLGSGNGPCEWFSSVQKGTGNTGGQSTYMTSYIFAYCSAAKDVASGGNGATGTMNFWDGFVNGTGLTAGSMGTNIVSVTVTGLPANTGLTSFLTTGFANCVAGAFIIGLGGGTVPIVVPDSNIAVSFRFDDLGSDGTLAATATFLSCVASCSGFGIDGQGMVDLIDNYCGGTFLTSFSFLTAGFGQSFSSVSFDIRELCAIDASNSVMASNGLGINTQVMAVPDAPDLGGTFSLSADCTGFPSALAFIRIAFAPGPAVVLGGTKGELLVNLTPGVGIDAALPHGGGVATLPLGSLPLDLSFFGFVVRSQGFCGNGPGGSNPAGLTNFTNLITVTVGSQE